MEAGNGGNLKRNASVLPVLILLIPVLMVLPLARSQDLGSISREEISNGLQQGTDSFTTVETYDSDGDGFDEIYMGGGGYTTDPDSPSETITFGIRAYEFNSRSGRWETFGTGLPGDGERLCFAGLGLGDVNGDGKMDIAGPVPTRWYWATPQEDAGIYIYSGDGVGNFDLLHRISLTDPLGQQYHDSSNEVEIVDLDGDGSKDIVASTYTGIRIFYGDGSGTNWEEQSPIHPSQTEISGIGIGDLNNDGLLDIVGTPYQYSTTIELYIQETARAFRSRDFKETSAGFGIKIADLDGDGNNDVVYGTANEGIRVWLGEGRTTLTSFPCTEASGGLPESDSNWNQVELGDLNGDGKLDIISACSSRNSVNVFMNDLPSGWTEIFTDQDELELPGDPYGANFGDWNGDGQSDLAGCSWEWGAEAWLVSIAGQRVPIADAGKDITAYIGDTVRLDGRDSYDPNGEIVSWRWECRSHTWIILSGADTSTPSFIAEEEDIYEFSLMVVDDEDLESLPSTVTVEVLDPSVSYKPVADAGPDLIVVTGDRVELDGSGSYDIDGEVEAYIWTVNSQNIQLQGDDTANPYFTAQTEGSYIITLIVEDDQGERSDPDIVKVEVSAKISRPRIGPFENSNGAPVPGLQIALKGSGGTFTKVTDDAGYADFQMGIPLGEYTMEVKRDGEVLFSDISIAIMEGDSYSVEGGSLPVIQIGDEGGSIILWVVIGVLAVIVVAAILLYAYSRKQKMEVVETAYVQEAPACPNCGSETQYMADFDRYYCQNCSSYT